MEGQKNQSQSDEIDLGQLFSRIGNSFRAGWLGFMRFLATMRRIPLENKVLFGAITVVTIALALYFTLVVRNTYYESKMIFSSDYLNKQLAESVIDKLNSLANESEKRGLSKTLGLSNDVAENIISFEIEPFVAENDVIELEVFKEQLRNAKTAATERVIDDLIRRIEVENRHSYEITVHTLKPEVIGNLQEGLINHFRTIPFIQKRVEINKQNLLDRQARLGRDIAKLDSLKLVTYKSYKELARGSNNVILNDKSSDPVLLYEQGLDIYQLYEDVTRDLYTQRDFEIIDGFTEFNSPANTSVSRMVLYSIIAGFVIAYIVFGLLRFNDYLANLK